MTKLDENLFVYTTIIVIVCQIKKRSSTPQIIKTRQLPLSPNWLLCKSALKKLAYFSLVVLFGLGGAGCGKSHLHSQWPQSRKDHPFDEPLYGKCCLRKKVIEKLNCLQDPREPYFSYKMQKLMSEPYIIRFFNNQHEHKRNPLEERRKLL